jgi:hypothetical protein
MVWGELALTARGALSGWRMSEMEDRESLVEVLPVEEERRRKADQERRVSPYGHRDMGGDEQWRPRGFQGASVVEAASAQAAGEGVGAHAMSAHGALLQARGHDVAPARAPSPPGPVQMMSRRAVSPSGVLRAAAEGVQGMHQSLPYLERIQAAFGPHDVGGVRAFVGGGAREASDQIGALAYATGDAVAFRDSPDLYTAAHEAAHIVQQRGGAMPRDGVSAVGDEHERHADAVAERVVRGQSAADLLGRYARPGAPSRAAAPVQRREGGQGGQGQGHERLEEAIAVIQRALEDGQKARSLKNPDQQGDDGKGTRGRIKQSMGRDPMEDLRVALAELNRLKEGGAEEEINAAVDAILSASKGDTSQAQQSTHGREDADAAQPPVQRTAAVAAAPLAAAGPPGWAVIAGLAIVSIGLAVYSSSRSRNEQAVEPRVNTRERAQERDTERQQHRGRLQVQGPDLRQEISFPWARNTPMTKAEALAALESLRGQLTRRELQAREQAFEQARRFIEQYLGTTPPMVSRSFNNRTGPSAVRVDVEIHQGTAFA